MAEDTKTAGATPAPGTALSTPKPTAVARPVSSAPGFEGTDSSFLKPPFIKTLTSGSPALETVPGAKMGNFYNEMNGDIAESIDFVPASVERVFLAWAPKRGGLKGRHAPESQVVADAIARNGGDEYGKLQDQDGNDLVDTRVIYGVVQFNNENKTVTPGILAFSSTGINRVKEWTGLATRQINPATPGMSFEFYRHVYNITSTREENDEGVWFLPKVGFGKDNDGKPATAVQRRLKDTDDLFVRAVEIYTLRKDRKLSVDYSQARGDGRGQGGGQGGKGNDKIPF